VIQSSITSVDLEQDIRQLGDKNTYEKYSNNPLSNTNMQVIQQGNNQNISLFGENMMSKDMKIHMEGNDRSMIIRNF